MKIKEQLLEEARLEREWKTVERAIRRLRIMRLSSRKASLKIRQLLMEEEITDGAWMAYVQRAAGKALSRPKIKPLKRRMLVAKTTTSTVGRRMILRSAKPEINPGDAPRKAKVEKTIKTRSAVQKDRAPEQQAPIPLEELPKKDTPPAAEKKMLPEEDGEAPKEDVTAAKADETCNGSIAARRNFPVSLQSCCVCTTCNLLLFDYGAVTGEKNMTCQCSPDDTYGFFWQKNEGKKDGDEKEEEPMVFSCFRARNRSYWKWSAPERQDGNIVVRFSDSSSDEPNHLAKSCMTDSGIIVGSS